MYQFGREHLAYLCENIFGELYGTGVADVEDGFIKAVEANLGKASENVETLVPLYVKKSQAEEEE